MKPRRIPSRAQKKHPETGRKLCLVCGQPVGKGRSLYCSDEHNLANSPVRIRWAVEYRDKGICAACACQCRLRTHWANDISREDWLKLPTWQADHIVPVAEGGGLCGIDGYRTLCHACHANATAAMARRLALKRRSQKQPWFFA